MKVSVVIQLHHGASNISNMAGNWDRDMKQGHGILRHPCGSTYCGKLQDIYFLRLVMVLIWE